MTTKEGVEYLQKKFSKGTRIVAEYIDTECSLNRVRSGDRGTVMYVDDLGLIHVDWDRHYKTEVVPDRDRIRIIKD